MISKRNFAEILENFLTAGHIAAAFLKIWLDLMQNLLANKLTITKIHRKSEWEISLNLSVGYIVLDKFCVACALVLFLLRYPAESFPRGHGIFYKIGLGGSSFHQLFTLQI